MAKRIVFYGPINNSKGRELFSIAEDYLKQNKGSKFFYILPNGKLLTNYRKKLLQNVEGAFDLNLFTFDDIVDTLLEDDFYSFVDEELKESVVSKILVELKEEGKIVYYKELVGMEGFTKSISSIIGEIKRSLIKSENFNKSIPNTLFYKEIGIVYERYQNFLEENNLVDREESFFKAIELLKKDISFLNKLDFILIDEFFDYRPQEFALLKEISKSSVDIYINMPFKTRKDFITINKTIQSLENLGFKLENIEKNERTYFEDMADKLFLEERTIKPSSNIKLIKAPNKYLELKKISQEIKFLMHEGMALNDIGIVFVEPNEYLKTMFKVFKEERIPCSVNEELMLIDIPLIKQFLNIIEVKIKNYEKQSLINRIKSSYFELVPNTERDKLEYILRKLNFESIDDLFYILEKEKNNLSLCVEKESEKYEEKLVLIKELEKALLKIKEETENFPSVGEIKNYITMLTNIVNSYNVLEKILDIHDITKDYQLLHRDINTLSRLKEVLEKINTKIALVYDQIKIEELHEIIVRYLEKETVITTLGNKEGVNILTPITARGIKCSVLFFVGLAQGKYPKLDKGNFFFNESTYEVLKNTKLDLKSYEEKLDKQSLMFIITLTRCKRILYLSYSESSMGEEKNIPSMFVDGLLNTIKGDKLEEKVEYIPLSIDYLVKEDIEDITTSREFIRHILYKYYIGEDCSEYFSLINSLDKNILKEINEKINCEFHRSKEEFNEYSGNIGDMNIKEDLRNIQKGKKVSITYFETYGKCPYKFLLNYILKLEEMERFLVDFTPLDRGNLYHEVLKEYYCFHKKDIEKDILGEEVFNVDDTLKEVENRIEKLIRKNGIKNLEKLWKIRMENMAVNIINLVKADLDRQRKGKYKLLPKAFEVEFGREEDFIIPIGNEEISIVGKIDRIDKVEGMDKYVVYDYKSSSYGIRKLNDIVSGVSFQLPVYIMAQKEKDIIAGGYIVISNGNINFELVKEEERNIVKKRKGKATLNEEEREKLVNIVVQYIAEYTKAINEGNFSINPKECDSYCIYKDICRYQGR